MNYQTILLEKENGKAILTLNRPDKMNALSEKMLSEIKFAIDKISKDKDIRGLIITGAGKAFAAGADITELQECANGSGYEFSHYGSMIFELIYRLEIPVIAAINGYALGGGCELALACHIRFGTPKTRMGQPEINLGAIPGYGGTARLPRIIGKARALEMILSGKPVNSDEAVAIGLLNRVFPENELLSETKKFMDEILARSPQAVTKALYLVQNSNNKKLADDLEIESRAFGEMTVTHDFKEGTSAFVEKRQPIFNNRKVLINN